MAIFQRYKEVTMTTTKNDKSNQADPTIKRILERNAKRTVNKSKKPLKSSAELFAKNTLRQMHKRDTLFVKNPDKVYSYKPLPLSNVKKNVYGYIRVSTETQAELGYGLRTQFDAIVKYCEEHELNLVNIYFDEGVSGAIGDSDDINKRVGLVELLSVLNGVSDIVVMNTSRLWRDDGAKVFVSRAVKKAKGDILSVEQPRYSLY